MIMEEWGLTPLEAGALGSYALFVLSGKRQTAPGQPDVAAAVPLRAAKA